MNVIVRNVLAVIVGCVIGMIVNMAIIVVSAQIIPPPAGVDSTTTEGLAAAMHLFEAKHFIFPFLAHAIGTFAGAFIAARIAATHKMAFAISIGVFFLIGGVTMAYQLPAPMWFEILDLTCAYILMGWLAGKLNTN